MKTKAIVWDMDGTLLNTLDDIIGACNDTLRAWNLPEKPKSEMIFYIGYGAKFLCQKSSGLDGDELTRFLLEYRQNAMHRNDPQTRIYDGILDILHEAKKRGMKLGIYTNKPQFWTEKLTSRFFGNDLFDAIVGVQEGCVLKPKSDGIDMMCEKWGIRHDEVIMIGDTPVDWETAQNAHCKSICVTWGFRTREILENAGATCIVDTAQELRDLCFDE